MESDVLKRKCLFAGLLAALICCGMSCTGEDTDVETLRKNQFVSEDTLLSITNGTSLADVRLRLGPAVRHQFTAVEAGHTWELVRCFVHTGEEESYTFYQLLFRGGTLLRTIGWIQMEREEYPYHGTTATRSKAWDIEDSKYVRKAIEAPAVAPEQIQAKLKDARETMAAHKSEGNIPRVVGYLFAPAFRAKAKKGYPVNEELRQRFDGCRVSIGMTTNEVQDLYGNPLHTFVTTNGLTARVYGDDRYLGNAVDTFLLLQYLAVVFTADGRVAAVYSDLFFCKDWYPNLPAWRRD